jgi:hypothetical protein
MGIGPNEFAYMRIAAAPEVMTIATPATPAWFSLSALANISADASSAA